LRRCLVPALALLGILVWSSPSSAERFVVAASGGIGVPEVIQASMLLGVCAAREGFRNDFIFGESGGVVLLDPSAGSGGGRLSLGYGFAALDDYLVIGLEACVTRTWGHSWDAKPNETYVGPNFVLVRSISRSLVLRCDLGALYRPDGPNRSRRLIPGVRLGLGKIGHF